MTSNNFLQRCNITFSFPPLIFGMKNLILAWNIT